MSYKQYWTRLEYVSTNNKGNSVYKFKCNICGHIYNNHNNAASHVSSCLKKQKQLAGQTNLSSFGIGAPPHTSPSDDVIQLQSQDDHEETVHFNCSPIDKALITLIADTNIPYTTINSTPWLEFLNTLNPNYQPPSKDKLRCMIIQQAKEDLQEGLRDFANSISGLAVDGATLMMKHCYAFILLNPVGLRLAGIIQVKQQDAVTLAKAVAEILNSLKDYNITISGIVSDNCPALVKSLTDNDPKNEYTLKALVGNEIVRCACSAHTGQLAINDLLKDGILSQFFNDVTQTLEWLKKRKQFFNLKCPRKIPTFVSTRWNTLFSCVSYLLENKEPIDSFLQEYTAFENDEYNKKVQQFNTSQRAHTSTPPTPPTPPPVMSIPDEWVPFHQALKVIAEFTDQIEGDLVLQQQVYVAVNEALRTLEELDTPVSEALHHFFQQRFQETADLSLAKLAYYLTPVGIVQYRALPSREKANLFRQLKPKFMEVSSTLSKMETLYFPSQLRFMLESYQVEEGDSPFYVYRDLSHESIIIWGINANKAIHFRSFALVCLAIVSLPASEAMVERAFSQIKSIASDFNKSMKSDLFIALSTLKLTIRYKRRYFFDDPDDIDGTEEEDTEML